MVESQQNSSSMKILLLAPHPFFQNRGTPIDVLLVMRALSERGDCDVDVVVYPEGSDIDLPRVTILRVPGVSWLKGIRPGFSVKKLIVDFFMFFYVWKLVRTGKYSLIHAGEEAVFIAMLMKRLYGIPYVYDLDSSVAQQLVEKMPWLGPIASLFNKLEGSAIRGALANAPVCNALSEVCAKNQSRKTVTLHDISQLARPDLLPTGLVRKEIASNKLILLYCGNLEKYQGVDLLIESFPFVIEATDKVTLAIIGGVPEDISYYKQKASDLGVGPHVHFLGPRPFDDLDKYLADADILVAPRIKGVNTPMKIFPYLHSGKPVLLTKLYTHTQIVSGNEAYLAEAEPAAFAKGIVELAENEELRKTLGMNGRLFVEKNHVYAAHKRRVDELYDWIKMQPELKVA